MKTYFIALTAFFLIDMAWLGFFAKNFYASQIGYLMKTNINWAAAVIFYLLFIGGLVYFVINPAIQQQSIQKLLIAGALFGLITYATYDLTNLATVKNWPILVTIVDLIWGMFLSTSVSAITYFIVMRLK